MMVFQRFGISVFRYLGIAISRYFVISTFRKEIMIFLDLFSLGREEEPLLFVVFDAGEPESDETCKDVDGQMARCG